MSFCIRKVIIPMSNSTIITQQIANMEATAVTFRPVGLHKRLFLRLPFNAEMN